MSAGAGLRGLFAFAPNAPGVLEVALRENHAFLARRSEITLPPARKPSR